MMNPKEIADKILHSDVETIYKPFTKEDLIRISHDIFKKCDEESGKVVNFDTYFGSVQLLEDIKYLKKKCRRNKRKRNK